MGWWNHIKNKFLFTYVSIRDRSEVDPSRGKMARFRSFMIADILSIGKEISVSSSDISTDTIKRRQSVTSNASQSYPTKYSTNTGVSFSSKCAYIPKKDSTNVTNRDIFPYLPKRQEVSSPLRDIFPYWPKRQEVTSPLRQTTQTKDSADVSRTLFPTAQERLAFPNVYITRPMSLYSSPQHPYPTPSTGLITDDDVRYCGVYGQRCADDNCNVFRSHLGESG
jgi:hypothetical protein